MVYVLFLIRYLLLSSNIKIWLAVSKMCSCIDAYLWISVVVAVSKRDYFLWISFIFLVYVVYLVLLSITNDSYTMMTKLYKTMYREREKILLVLLVL